MAQEVKIAGATYSDVPSISVPDSNDVFHSFYDVTATTAAASDVAQGKYFYTANGTLTEGTASGGGAAITITDTTDAGGGTIREITAVDISQDTVTASVLYSGYTAHDRYGNLVNGSASPGASTQTKSATPTESEQTITPDSGYLLSSVTVGAISSSYVGSGVTRRTSTDLSSSGNTVSVPAGYYESAASKAVASGTEGTPTATKGTVSNHAISVTPSVTNTAGYISGGTKTGTAVSVSASELVSGTYTVSASGTADVTNYASLIVPAGSAGTPTATKGTVSNNSVVVTPSVTNSTGWITGSTKSGFTVTVSASELVSGSETKSANGTYDVTNLASLVVAVPIVTYYTGSSAPSSSLGSNGDIYLQTS